MQSVTKWAANQAEAFTAAVKPALEAMYGVMETTRIALTGGVGMLTGEGEPMDTMGAEEPAWIHGYGTSRRRQ